MAKQRITREMIVNAAFQIAQQEGIGSVQVKRIADALECSVQPIYSYCTNMDDLRAAVVEKANDHMQAYMACHINPEEPFRSTGFAYVHYAKAEPHLFQLFLQRKRPYVSTLTDLYKKDADPRVPQVIAQRLGISLQRAMELHLNMLVYTTGIGEIMTTSADGLSEQELMDRMEGAYQAFLQYALRKEEDQK